MAAAASLWSLIFAAVHLLWACGWYVGLDAVAAAAAFDRPWFLSYDVVVAVACLIAASAFGVVAANHRGRLRAAAHAIIVRATVVVAARAVTGLFALAWRGVGLAGALASGWDVWFVLGAILFGAALRARSSPERGGTVNAKLIGTGIPLERSSPCLSPTLSSPS
jgi:hypothetical protein